jgi:hypothetical protein
MGARGGQPLREMVEAGKTITMISLRLKRTVTAVRGRLGILKVSLGRVGRRPKRATEAGGLPEMQCAHVLKKKNDRADALSCEERIHRLDGLGQACPSSGKIGRRPTGDSAHRRTGTRNQRRTDQKIILSAERRAIASLMNFERPPDWKPPSRRRAGGPPTMFARIGVMRALNRHVERVFNSERPPLGRRKLARDR